MMKITSRHFLMIFAAMTGWLGLAHVAFAQTYATLTRADGARTPVKIYGAAPSVSCLPLMIISHGFGGSREGLSQLALTAARSGYRVFVMSHAESGRKQLRTVLRAADRRAALVRMAGDAYAHRARFMDLDATWSAALSRCHPPFAVLAGHSMGAQTVMMEAGAVSRIGRMGRDRFDAYIAMSPQGVGLRFAPGAWRAVHKPVLMITGTRDRGVDGDYRTRLTAFDGLPTGRKRLAVLAGANHRNVGGRGLRAIARLSPIVIMAYLRDIKIGRRAQYLPGVKYREK